MYNEYYTENSNRGKKNLIFAVVVIIVSVFLLYSYNTKKTYTVTITDKGIKESKYMVFSKDDDDNVYPFEIEDSIFCFRWDSSDMYGKLEVGDTYKVDTIGWRVPLFSWYENIVSAERIE